MVPLTIGEYVASTLPMLGFQNESGPVERDMSNGGGNPKDGSPMRIAGNDYRDGFGVSTPSNFELHLGGRVRTITVEVGIDDETPDTRARVAIFGDGIELASTEVASGDAAQHLTADVTGVRTLTLSTSEVAAGDTAAHVDWASARLIVDSTSSQAITPDAGH
jgi:hypothetical protein